MNDEHENSVKIAVLQEQILGLREQQKAHNESTQGKFAIIESKIDSILSTVNHGRGAYVASLAVLGTVGAAALGIISWIINYFHK
jgi:hypothetical protein